MQEHGRQAALDRVRDAALVLLLAFAVVVNYRAFRDYAFEDAYITFRYARNLAAGQGFVFNAGERVLGTSTPLMTLLLAGLGAAGLDIVTSAAVLYSLCLGVCGYFGALYLGRRGFPNAGVLFALAAVWGAGGVFAFFGMETTLHLALVFLALLAALGDRPWTTGVLCGLVATDRYDGVVVAAVVLLQRWIRARRPPWREAAACAALFGGWLLFALLYFGSPLPNTLHAKEGVESVHDYLRLTSSIQYEHLFSPLRRFWPLPDVPLAGLVICVPALLRARRLLRSLWVLPAIGAALWIGYACIGPPANQAWHLTPAVYVLLAFCLAGWDPGSSPRRLAPAASAAALGLVLVSSAFLASGARNESESMQRSATQRLRVDVYDRIATWIVDHGLDREPIYALEIGYLTYTTGQPAVDGAGLVTPGIQFHGPRSERTSTRTVLLDTVRPSLALLKSQSGTLEGRMAAAYRPLFQAQPHQLLVMRRGAFQRYLERLYESWLDRDFYYPGDRPTLRHPLAVDFETHPAPGWNQLGNRSFVGRPSRDLRFRGESVPDRHLRLYSSDKGTVWSDPFLIDFDELSFRFGATDPHSTTVQLYVAGLRVFELGGRGSRPPVEMDLVELPVYAWRGKVGVLRFVAAGSPGQFLVADHVLSRRYENVVDFEDFDSGEYGERWVEGFGPAPLSTRTIARRLGLQFVQGSHAAVSLYEPGAQRLASRPFRIERDHLCFSVYDFGGAETGVVLRVGDDVVRRFSGRQSRSLVALDWDVSAWRGREAELEAFDDSDDPELGIGIDSILLYDRALP